MNNENKLMAVHGTDKFLHRAVLNSSLITIARCTAPGEKFWIICTTFTIAMKANSVARVFAHATLVIGSNGQEVHLTFVMKK